MKKDSTCSIEGPTRKTAPLWISVLLFFLFVLSLLAAALSFLLSITSARELEQLRSDLAARESELSQVKQDLSAAESTIVDSRYVILAAQDYIDSLLCYIDPDYSNTNIRIALSKCASPLYQAMEDIGGHPYNNLLDFSNQFYSDYCAPISQSNSVEDPLSSHKIILSPPSDTPEIELPENGKIFHASTTSTHTVAPLTISTKGDGYYYVKLKDHSTGKEVLGFFVYGGTDVTVDVPLGKYDLVYAYGHEWLGVSKKFGSETIYSKANDTFLFYQENGYVNGWTVELYLQTDGNLDVNQIPASEF